MKYAIVEKSYASSDKYWEAHKYSLWFRVFGPTIVTYVQETHTTISAIVCRDRLIEVHRGTTKKFAVIEIIAL
jgi:hypothetical protein